MDIFDVAKVQNDIVKVVQEMNDKFKTGQSIDINSCPGKFIRSAVLVTAVDDLAAALGWDIPNSCYPFFDKKDNRQLNIKEATQKLFELWQKTFKTKKEKK